jgi:hypothetical protein
MTDEIRINPELFSKAKEIFGTLALQRPEHSLSFVLSSEGAEAVFDTIKIVEWGIGGNKPKLKATALEVLGNIGAVDAGSPINVNLTEYEIKAMGEVVEAIDKAESNHQDGMLS